MSFIALNVLLAKLHSLFIKTESFIFFPNGICLSQLYSF